MLQNPFSPSPDQAKAWSEGFCAALAAVSSPSPGEDIGPDATDAFNQGVQAGAAAQTDGIDLGITCVAAGDGSGEDSGPDVGEALHGLEIVSTTIRGFKLHKLVGGLTELLVGLFIFVAGGGRDTQPPAQVLPDLGQPLVDQLAAMGAPSLALFLGVGIDPGATDCEFKLTPLFVTQDQAKTAAVATGRASWLVVSWRTDQCGSFAILDSAG